MNTLSLTASGRTIDLLKPAPEVVCIEDIGRALSRQCRFNGHCSRFYSVAEHSWLVSHVAEQLEPADPLQALLHDAAEAYLGDIITPLKNTMPAYRDLEDRWLRAIGQALGFDMPLLASTQEADRILVNVEGVALMDGWAGCASITQADLRLAYEWRGVQVVGLRPDLAFEVFMDHYYSLKARLAPTR